MIAIAALAVLTACKPAPDGNPRADEPQLTAQQRQAEADNDKEVRDLADEVTHGDKSFEQAGCEHRGGDWDDDRRICVREFMISRSDTKSTQDSVLTDRIAALAAASDDATACTTVATRTARGFLADHPRD